MARGGTALGRRHKSLVWAWGWDPASLSGSWSQATTSPLWKRLLSSACWRDWTNHVGPLSLWEWMDSTSVSPTESNTNEKAWKNSTPAHTSIKYHCREKRISAGPCEEYRWAREGSTLKQGEQMCASNCDRGQAVVSPREWNKGISYLGVTTCSQCFVGKTSSQHAPKAPGRGWGRGGGRVSDASSKVSPFH